MIYILFKFSLFSSAQEKIKGIAINIFPASDIDKLIGCLIENSLETPIEFTDYLLLLIQELRIMPLELVHLIYTLSYLPNNTQQIFEAIPNFLEKSIENMPKNEKLLIFIALVNNHKESQQIFEIFQKQFNSDLNAIEIVSAFPVFIKRNNLFLPWTQGLLDALFLHIQGRAIETKELVTAMYSLCKLKYSNEIFWKAALEAAIATKITSAEEYIQVKKTIKEISKLGIDISKYITHLESTYESN